MALDAGFLKAVARELRGRILNYKVDKIHEPTRDEIILQLRGFTGGVSLLLSANANSARVHLTGERPENPASPPMFCMLLRKHLSGAKLISIDQPEFERVVYFCFSGYNEFSEPAQKTLAMEIMGRHSNIVLFDAEQRIIDAIRHVDATISSQRQVLPGLFYQSVPSQNKLDPLSLTKGEILSALSGEDIRRADQYLLDTFCGLSPLVLREVLFRGGCDADAPMNHLTPALREEVARQLWLLAERIRNEDFTPVMLLNPADKKPKDFSFLDIGQYGSVVEKESYESFSALLDDFYKKRDAAERMRQKSQDIQKTVANALSRAAKKLNAQQLELKEAKGRERLKLFGDLVMANLHRLSKGEKSLEAENYYEDPPAPVAIPLDERLTPAQNAQKYYKDYARAKNKEKYLTEQIRAGQEEIAYLETIFESLGRAENERELNEIRQELAQNGSVAPKKAQREKGKKQKQNEPTQPMKFVSDDGFTILVGKNNLQNDRLTLKTAAKQDLWLHTKNIPGSHTVIFSQGKAIPPQTVTQAAVLAATYSKAKNSHQVPVDYTVIKNVKKPSGAKPGMVIYDHYETAVVSPDEGLAERLRAK